MNLKEYEKSVRTQINDLCRCSLRPVEGLADGEAQAAVITELLIAAAKMMSCHTEESQRKTVEKFYEMIQEYALITEVTRILGGRDFIVNLGQKEKGNDATAG